jgi:Ca2+/Na+ antiporter
MSEPSPIYALIGYVFYPLWLIGGGIDYLCHRRTAIERTAGFTESLYHLGEFVTIAIIVLGIALFDPSLTVFAILIAAVVLHTALSYLDVTFTERRRYISPLEQHAHALMDVMPLAVVALVIVLEWSNAAHTWAIHLRDPMLGTAELLAVLVTLLIGAGGFVVEELWRTAHGPARSRDDHIGLATIK